MGDRCWNCGDYIDENGKGCICDRQHTAYVELQAQCARLEGENERMRKALERYVSKFGNCGDAYDEAKVALKELDYE